MTLPEPLVPIAAAVAARGGRAFIVGGYVRDRLLGLPASSIKDIDIEVFGLQRIELQDILATFGTVQAVGKSFPVFRLRSFNVDFALPVETNPNHAMLQGVPSRQAAHRAAALLRMLAEASRRRDLTINSMAVDVLTAQLIDPHGGHDDLRHGILRATDPDCFGEDPLRALRVAQFLARFDMRADPPLEKLVQSLDLSNVPAERVFEELKKLLLKGQKPALGFEFLRKTGQIRLFPDLAALIGVPQDARWHPEGDVWTHTLMVVDEAARLRREDDDDPPLMFAALCHDFGKPATTVIQPDGRVCAYGHDMAGAQHARQFLLGWRAPNALVNSVGVLVENHLAPALLVKDGASAKALRRLARKLEHGGASMELLGRLALADHLGRATPEARSRHIEALRAFAERTDQLQLSRHAARDVVLGRHVLARGVGAGERVGILLAVCRDIQYETGWTDPNAILDEALKRMENPGVVG